jgi:hypothetical protein
MSTLLVFVEARSPVAGLVIGQTKPDSFRGGRAASLRKIRMRKERAKRFFKQKPDGFSKLVSFVPTYS